MTVCDETVGDLPHPALGDDIWWKRVGDSTSAREGDISPQFLYEWMPILTRVFDPDGKFYTGVKVDPPV